MSIRDIFSNFKIDFQVGSATGISRIGGNTQSAGQLSMGLGSTGFILGTISAGSGSVIESITLNYSLTIVPFVPETAFDEVFDVNNVLGVSPLGNSLIDLETGLPVVFPFDVDAEGGLYFGLSIVNPAETFRFASFRTQDSGQPFFSGAWSTATGFVGPLRNVSPTKVIGSTS